MLINAYRRKFIMGAIETVYACLSKVMLDKNCMQQGWREMHTGGKLHCIILFSVRCIPNQDEFSTLHVWLV
jgi:hypothetical protein